MEMWECSLIVLIFALVETTELIIFREKLTHLFFSLKNQYDRNFYMAFM